MPIDLRARFRGVLLGGLVGDGLGLPFEGTPASGLERLGALVDRRAAQPGYLRYSDDTEMAMGVAESLVRRTEVDPHDVLDTLVANYDPARGYGKGMTMIVRALREGSRPEDAATIAWAEGSRGNGGAARVGPIACLFHDDGVMLRDATRAITRTTHASESAIQGAILQAQAIAALLRTTDALDPEGLLGELLAGLPPEETIFRSKLEQVRTLLSRGAAPRAEVVAVLGHGVEAHESVPLALFAFLQSRSDFATAVVGAIKFGGDTDSIGAMTGSLAGARFGDVGIPPAWLAASENRRRGRDHVAELADALFALWRPRSPPRYPASCAR
jgi:poly(ADP-ribose) glycohydrolase ARH3